MRADIETKLLSLVEERGTDKSICPSEVVRSLDPENWRKLMPACLEIAITLAKQGKIEVCQKGSPVDPLEIEGPIRLRQRGKSSNQN